MLPADYITWVEPLEAGINSAKNRENVGAEIWTIGTASTTAREKLKDTGWHLEEKSAKKIGFIGSEKINK